MPDKTTREPTSADLRTDVAHSARVYDYLLGGKDNYAADRAAAEEVVRIAPYMRTPVRADRDFMVRAARHLAAERGVRQFLDAGTGLPTSPNLHEVVQEADPSGRVVYVDNDHGKRGCAHGMHRVSPGQGGQPVEPQVARPVGNGRTDRSCSRAR
ncbi:SAM-dependent methyltransferase [Spirillospora sp. CA-108201]